MAENKAQGRPEGTSGGKVVVSAAEFVQGATSLAGLPKARLPEIALVGRSNVGKSSLINRLANRAGLARASSTPGRTQEVNLFKFTLRAPGAARPATREVHLADLPGYGYAKVAHGKREALVSLIGEYLTGREGLRAVCLLVDCRRDPGDEEREIAEFASEEGRRLLVTVTKADKLGRAELEDRLEVVADGLGVEPADLVVTGEKLPVAPWWERALPLLSEPTRK